ncbi:hypothetical protein L1887_30550 [Cichorium endivia]|nr:hypothetical protein L1887_30550 [Cichorium endivia]
MSALPSDSHKSSPPTAIGLAAYKGVTLIILVVHNLFPILYEGAQLYWKSHVNKLKVILQLILAADLIVNILYLSPIAIYSLLLKISPYIRGLEEQPSCHGWNAYHISQCLGLYSITLSRIYDSVTFTSIIMPEILLAIKLNLIV